MPTQREQACVGLPAFDAERGAWRLRLPCACSLSSHVTTRSRACVVVGSMLSCSREAVCMTDFP